MTKLKPGKSISLNIYISRGIDTIITLQGVPKIWTTLILLVLL